MIPVFALALVLMLSLIPAASATQVAILAPHKSGLAPHKSSQVTACSKKHSARCVSGPVKSYRLGQKVRLPGGTWIDCAGDCQDKLRSKTVDFWYDKTLRQ